ncbi:flippase [Actinoplanes sp. NPDC051859]|uniref:flippase n=1 Tax=Actinoplanes sp. NPDC051859 TaxID=3363909 RepID=UPI0037BBEC55
MARRGVSGYDTSAEAFFDDRRHGRDPPFPGFGRRALPHVCALRHRMSQAQRILKNAAALYVAEILARAMLLIQIVLVARMLGSTEFGKQALVLSVLAIAGNVTDFGFSTLGVKLIAAEPHEINRIGSAMLTIKVAVGFLTSAVIIAVVLVARMPADLTWMFIFSALTLISTAYTTSMSSIYRGREIMQYDAYGRIGLAFLTTASGALLLVWGKGIVAIVAMTSALTVVNALYMKSINSRRKLFQFQLPESVQQCNQLAKQALPFVSLAVLIAISYRVDTLILGLFESTTVVGEYSAAYRIFELFLIVPAIFAGVLLPATSARLHSDEASAQTLTMTALRYFLYLSLPLAVGLSMLSEPIIDLVYGDEYPGSVVVLQLMSFTVIPTFIGHLTANLFHASKRPQRYTYIALFSVFFNIFFSFLLIPMFGMVGAAVTSVATQSIVVVIGTYLINRHIIALPFWQDMWRPAIASAVMAAGIYLYQSIWLIPGYVLIYLVVLYAVRGFSERDLEMVRSALHARRKGAVAK